MSGWSDFIQTGSYDGIVFDFVGTRDHIERVVDRQQMPNRDGVFLEDRARAGLVFDVMAIVVEDDYPGVMNNLRASILAGGIKEFIHPIFGKFKAIVTFADIAHDADDAIDSATMQLHVEEHTETAQALTPVRTSVAAKSGALRDGIVAALNAATLFGGAVDALEASGNTLTGAEQAVVDQALSDGNTGATLATAAADAFEQDGDEMSADEIQAQANAVLTKCDAVVSAISAFTTAGQALPEQYDFAQAMIALATLTSALADVVATGRPVLTTSIVAADITLLAWVHATYGDSSRADEVLALNPWISDPLLLLAGSEVTHYAP